MTDEERPVPVSDDGPGGDGGGGTPEPEIPETPSPEGGDEGKGKPDPIVSRLSAALDGLFKAAGRIRDSVRGSDEKPLDPFSLRARIHRWYLKKYKGYVTLITTAYNKPEDEYICRTEIVKRSELDRDVVPVTGMKKTYHWDLDLVKRGFDSTKDNGFTAVDAYLYMRCNKIEDAMRIPLDDQNGIDAKKFILIACAVAGALIALWVAMRVM